MDITCVEGCTVNTREYILACNSYLDFTFVDGEFLKILRM